VTAVTTFERHTADARPPLQAALDDILEWARRRIGFEHASVMAYDPDALLPVGFAVTEPDGPERAMVACRIEQVVADVDKFRELATRPLPVATMSIDDPLARSSARWEQINNPAGHRHELRAAFVDRHGRCWGAMNLRRPDRPFTPADITVVAANLGSLASSIARAMVRGPNLPSDVESGTVWLDDHARLTHRTPSADGWLDRLASVNSGVPATALVTVVALRVLHRPTDGDITTRVRLPSEWVTLHGEPLLDTSGALEGVAVVIDAAHPRRLMPLAAAAYGLTRREGEVTTLVLKGRATKTIATELRITEYTVQDHLKSVFAKVGVSSRGELAHALATHLT